MVPLFWPLKVVLIAELVLGLVFALSLLLDWLQSFLKMHFQNRKKKDRP